MSATLPDGIYFRMPMDQYLAVERLSKSGIKRLRISPADFWADSWLNPLKEELTPEQERYRERAKMIGRAYHSARLEPELFAKEYVREPGKEEAPEGTLFTATDMKPELKERELKLSGSTEEQALRLAEDGFPREKLWHLVMADWEASVPEGAIRLSSGDYDKIAEDGRRLRSVESVASLLTGGAAEVSVLYTCPETGIPMKARFDYLRPEMWVELKTFSNSNGKHLIQCIMDAFRFNSYHLDAGCYLDAAHAIARDDLKIMGEAEMGEINLIKAVKANAGDLRCTFLFQQTGGCPNILTREFQFYEDDPSDKAIADLKRDGATAERIARAENMKRVAARDRIKTAIHTKAVMEMRAAKRDYQAYLEIYGNDPWLPLNPHGVIDDNSFPPYWLEEL